MTLSDAAEQVIGFIIQTAPIAFLQFFPFNDNELRFSRKRLCAAVSGLVVAFAVGFAVFLSALGGETSELVRTCGNIYMCMFIAVMETVYCTIVRVERSYSLLVMIVCIHYAAVLFTINNLVMSFAKDWYQPGFYNYDTPSTLLNLAATALTLPLEYVFLSKTVHRAARLMESKALRRGVAYFSTALVVYCLAVFVLVSVYPEQYISAVVIAVFLGGFIVTDLILYIMFFSETLVIERNNELRSTIDSFNERYRSISESVNKFRCMHHDVRHHLNVISSLNNKGDYKALTEYLENYAETINGSDVALCGYFAIDNVLSYYISDAKSKGIDVKTKFSAINADMSFEVTDITVLVGNLMENAIEACSEAEEKRISVSVRRTGASLLFLLENTCKNLGVDSPQFTDGGKFFSTKHSRDHGLGIKSVRMIAEKYEGSAEFKRSNGVFTVRVVLNNP